jgi:hypothetical protein
VTCWHSGRGVAGFAAAPAAATGSSALTATAAVNHVVRTIVVSQ